MHQLKHTRISVPIGLVITMGWGSYIRPHWSSILAKSSHWMGNFLLPNLCSLAALRKSNSPPASAMRDENLHATTSSVLIIPVLKVSGYQKADLGGGGAHWTNAPSESEGWYSKSRPPPPPILCPPCLPPPGPISAPGYPHPVLYPPLVTPIQSYIRPWLPPPPPKKILYPPMVIWVIYLGVLTQ